MENESYLYGFFEIEKVFGTDNRELTFTAKLAEGSTATSYVILGVKDCDREGGGLVTKVFDGKKNNGEYEDETNFYSEGGDLFFALSERKLKGSKYLTVFLRISPQTSIYVAISSIQLLTVSVLVTLALEIHSQPFYRSFSLITGLFLALLTLLLYPERSRLMDTRTSVSFYSVILSTILIFHALSRYMNLKLVSDFLNTLPVLRSLLIPAVLVLMAAYIGYSLLDWAHRRGIAHMFSRRNSSKDYVSLGTDKR